MSQNLSGKARVNENKKLSLSIPEITRRIRYEKITETVPVKLPSSLATYVREHGGSKLLREALIAYLL